jgi:hypothetical protein
VRDFFEELTLGATRISVVGLGSGGVGGIPSMVQPSSGTSAFSQPQTGPGHMSSGRGASTQIGEPLFPEGAPMGPGTTAPQRTMAGQAFDPNQGHVAHAAVPTAGGQAYPTPPQKSGSGMVIIGIIAFLAIGGGAGGFWYWKNRASTDDDGGSTAKTKTTATSKSKDGDDDDDGKAAGSSSATASASATASTTSSTGPDASASASAGPDASSSAIASTTTTSSATTTTTATHTATSTGPQPGIDGCCRSAPRAKKALCNSMNSGIKSGKLNRQQAINTLRGQGVNCN